MESKVESKVDPIVEARAKQKHQETLQEFAKLTQEYEKDLKEELIKVMDGIFEKINNLDEKFKEKHGEGLELFIMSSLMRISTETGLSMVNKYYPGRMALALQPFNTALKQYGFEIKEMKQGGKDGRIITR